MKDLINKVKLLRREANPAEVQALINDLGPTPSIAVLEEVLKHYKRVEKGILSNDLLEWMRENDLEKFENDDVRVSIKPYVSAKVNDPDSAFEWLENNQYGDLIKDTLDFPKGELSREVLELLDQQGLSYNKKSGIHPQSLKKIISDRLKSGEDIPSEDNGIEVKFYDECVVKEK